MRLQAFFATVALAASTALAANSKVHNKCDFPVWVTPVSHISGQTAEVAPGGRFSTKQSVSVNNTGTAIKVTQSEMGLYTGKPVLSLMYSYAPNALYYGIGQDHGFDFWGKKIRIHNEDGLPVPEIVWNGEPKPDFTAAYLDGEADLTLELCDDFVERQRFVPALCGYPVSHNHHRAYIVLSASVSAVAMARNGSPSPADHFPLGHSATSPQPQPSKRDKRRTMLADKLAEMMASFSDNRDSHYRAQLAALQADINLIMKADPYANRPLEDDGEEASGLIAHIMGSNVPTAPSAGTDYIAQCGKHYSRFVGAVNDAMEERDYNLTMLLVSATTVPLHPHHMLTALFLQNKHENAKNEIENSHYYKVQIAEEEHKLLAATIRERLMASIQQRTSRLKREKEQLDLSDSNAMLLHPNQFGIGNPVSPGGPQAPRKTRRTGHKFGDADELAAANENKRKRKLFEDQDNDSPGPAGRNVEIRNGSPFREAKARTINAQFESAAYSLERLFTEKELNMALNQATTAASHFFAKMKNAEAASQEAIPNGNANGANGDHASENGDAMDQDQDSDDIPGASDMVRQISSNPHATRGATRSALNPTAAIVNGQIPPFIYHPPVCLDAKIFQKVNAAAPPPTALSMQDVEQDLKLMLRDAQPDDELNEKLLIAACNPVKARDYQVQPPSFMEPVNEITSCLRSTAPHLEVGAGLGGVPMSAQSSMAGWSDAGGNTPLGRYGDRENLAVGGHSGGVAMTRTASGSGRGRGRGRGGG
ncbi:hypothetical protein EJ02DRAFT_463892 [Clathrospora elynae]|uniref:Uncharacterized protein n=1 Tax=Clathrospora elynae TaxID=706981 RepID=A0A6A5T256_9PLEO|nr:hypothetical protein EJ02DRAFT_463892 [Clathrospora elynae]